jgi:hypothetical protein
MKTFIIIGIGTTPLDSCVAITKIQKYLESQRVNRQILTDFLSMICDNENQISITEFFKKAYSLSISTLMDKETEEEFIKALEERKEK